MAHSGTIAQTLPALTQSMTGTYAGRSGTIAQSLPILTQSLSGVIFNPNDRTGTIAQTLVAPKQSMTGTFVAGVSTGTIAQTLPLLIQTMRGIANSVAIDITEAADSVTEWGNVVETLLVDTAEASDVISDQVYQTIVDSVEVVDSITEVQTLSDSLLDTVEVADSSLPLWIDILTDTVEAVDSDPGISDSVIDSVEVIDSVTEVFTVTQVIVDTVEVSDDTPWEGLTQTWFNSLTDIAEASDSILSETRIVLEIVEDNVEVVDSTVELLAVSDLSVDVVIATDLAPRGPSTLLTLVVDTAVAQDSIFSADPNALAWVVNLETGAPWFYTNFDFTSIAEQAGMLFGASQDGFYLLEGADDAGTNIDSELKTGFLDFEIDHRKYIPDIYFGYTTDGELEVDVETFDHPTDIYTYGLEPREASAPRNTRIKPGKGLVSRYWRFTIRNISGAAYQIYNNVADIVVSKRRL